MKRINYRIGFSLACGLVVALGESRVESAQHYTVLDLGTLPDYSDSQACGINDSRKVAGYAWAGTPLDSMAFIWGAMTSLGTLGGDVSSAYGINNNGHVVGRAEDAYGSHHAFLHDGATMIDLGTLPCCGESAAYDINDAEQVIGTCSTGTGETHAFIWQDDVMDYVADPEGPYSWAHGINDLGQVVGGIHGVGAFVWDGDTLTILDPLPTGEHAWGGDISNAGLTVGTSQAGDFDHACVWGGEGIIDLGTFPGGEYSNSYAVSESGFVIGQSETEGYSHAFIWNGGQLVDLNDYVNPMCGDWEFLSANDLNDNLTIVGHGLINGQSRAFLWVWCPGDVNCDGEVNALDTTFVKMRIGCSVGTGDVECDSADANGDGEVNPSDVAWVIKHFGLCEGGFPNFPYSQDCNGNDIADECELDCGHPWGPCDVPGCGLGEDYNGNDVPDECDLPGDFDSDNDVDLDDYVTFEACMEGSGVSVGGVCPFFDFDDDGDVDLVDFAEFQTYFDE